jgi:beta-lactamase regulating signal transducer with metallopeptidase domain
VPVFVAWLIGMALFAVAALCRYRRLTREWSAGAECSLEPELMRLAASAAQRMGLKRLPLIQVRSGAAGPGVVGFLRPVVVLPEELVSCARPEQVEHVLLHELAHVRRGDPMTSLACLVLQLLYWFHPLVWVARRRLATCVEVCCDRRVALLLEGSAPAYRRTLLELARALVHRPALGRIGFVHRHSQLLARLEWLERPFTHRSVVHKTVTVSLLVVMLVCCLPLAPASFQPPRVSLPESPEGCLRLRYAVFSALAQEEVNGERFVASSVQSDQIHVNGG